MTSMPVTVHYHKVMQIWSALPSYLTGDDTEHPRRRASSAVPGL